MYVLQIGSNVANDDTFRFISARKGELCYGLIIDASPACVLRAKEAYLSVTDKLEFLQTAVSDRNEPTVEFFFSHETQESASISSEHHQFHSGGKSQSMIVPNKHINDVLRSFKGPQIDRLYIDVEGVDCDILLAIDWEIIPIKYIQYETFCCDGPRTPQDDYRGSKSLAVIDLLTKLGYTIDKTFDHGNQIIATHE